MKKSQPEKQIENAILDYLLMVDGMFWKAQNVGIYDPRKGTFRRPGKYHKAGVADILGIIRGRFVAIEVKTKTGRLSKSQAKFLDEVRLNGGIAFVARSVEECDEQLRSYFPKRTSTSKIHRPKL